jgi:citrate synthase
MPINEKQTFSVLTQSPAKNLTVDYLTREEALDILQVKRSTLYSYVSRGLIRCIKLNGNALSHYSLEDIKRLKAKSSARAGHGPVAAGAMRWGDPVILTSITAITPDGPRYRRRLATDIVRSNVPFEVVTEYLWTGHWNDGPVVWQNEDIPSTVPQSLEAVFQLHPNIHILQLLAQATMSIGISESSLLDRNELSRTDVLSARRLISAMTGVFGFLGPTKSYVMPLAGESIADTLARSLGLSADPVVICALNSALVLVADHELNPATFAARIAASWGAQFHSCISAALDVHYGIGKGCDRVEALFSSSPQPEDVVAKVLEKIEQGQRLEGFSHRLYPLGDPRSKVLMKLAHENGPYHLPTQSILKALQALENKCSIYPNIETGLVLISRSLNLAPQAAGALFALGRSAGWVAHILEQRLAGFEIRPRAQFTDPYEGINHHG